ncbi:MAG: ABC transporter substrate-binding protein/permease [Pirellulales bacterium]
MGQDLNTIFSTTGTRAAVDLLAAIKAAVVLTLAALALPLPALAADMPTAEWLRQRFPDSVLRWGGDAEGAAPYQLRAPEDPEQVIGFEVELSDALAEVLSQRMGAPLRAQFVQYEWVSLALGLAKQDFDCILSGFEVTPENKQAVLFSRPYYRYAQLLVVRADDNSIHGLADCVGKPVGTMAGSAAERVLSEAGVRDILGFDGQVEPYLDLETGRLDAVLLDAPAATFYGLPNPRLKAAGTPLAPGIYAIGLRPDEPQLAAAFNDALAELIRNGRLRRILRKWHLWNDDQARLAEPPDNAAELAGLGFNQLGQPLVANEPPPADAVDKNIIATSAQRWTFGQYAVLLLQAAGMTVMLTVCSMAVAMSVGLFVAVGRLFGPTPLRWLALGYVELFRGIPLLLLLFFLYYGLPELGGGLSTAIASVVGYKISPAILTAIVGFGLNYAAFEAEIYRSSIQSVPRGQWEAGQALGMSDPLTFRRVIFPQAFRTALGPMTNDFVAMFKDTSLVSVIAVRELTKEYLILARSSFEFVKLGALTALLYLAMSIPLGYLSRWLEKKWGPGK